MVLLILLLSVICFADQSIKFLVHNMDDGTDFVGLTTTPPAQFEALLLYWWQEVERSQPIQRARLIGDEILQYDPDIVALVEIPHFAITYPNGTVENRYDSLADTMQVVEQSYQIVTVQNLSSYTFFVPLLGIALTFTDRQAILANTQSAGAKWVISNVQAHEFQTTLTVPSPLGPISFLRGWIQLDLHIKSHNKDLRVITTHAETTAAEPIQFAEMQEIFTGPAHTDKTLVFLGDFNAGPEINSDVYNFIRAHGLADAWERTHSTTGYTWAIFPEDGQNSILDQQIDIVFYDNSTFLVPEQVEKIGGTPTEDGLYPADHFGVFTKFAYA